RVPPFAAGRRAPAPPWWRPAGPPAPYGPAPRLARPHGLGPLRPTAARTRPAGVSSAPGDVRSNSVTRRSRSSARICCESDGAAMCNRRAAAAKRASSATVRKYLSWRRSTEQATAGQAPDDRRVRPALTGLWFYVTAHAVECPRPGYDLLVAPPPAGRAAGSVAAGCGPAPAEFPGERTCADAPGS